MIFLFFGERGKRGKGFGVANVNWGFEGRWGIKVEFGGFIGGFGKIFFTKGGIKKEKEGFGGGWREKRGKGIGKFWVMYGKGCDMEYSLMECFL